MSFFISEAYAEGGAAAGQAAGGGLGGLIPLILIFVLFYFLLIRPQTKRAKEHKQMVEALDKGDEVVTNGGILGKVVGVEDNFATLEIANGVEVKLQKNAVTAILPKGTVKSAE